MALPEPWGPFVDLFGQHFCNVTREEAGAIVESMMARPKERARIVCVKDVALLMRCREDAGLERFYREADVVFVDGRGLCYASRLLGRPLREMVGGPGLYEELLKVSAQKGYRVAFIGAKPEVVREAVARASARHPGLSIVAAHHGYLDAGLRREVVRTVRESGAQLVMIGMGTPVREAFLTEVARDLAGTVCVCVGGVFDVEAGVTRLAPKLVGRLGLEWLYRCLQEPRRLAGRYFHTHPRFVLLLISALFKRQDA